MTRLSSGRWLIVATIVLLVNSAYLWASSAATLWYFANVVSHPLLGIALAVVAAAVLKRHGGTPLLWLAAAPLAISLAFGVAVLWWGATRPYRWLIDAHVLSSAIGAVLLCLFLARLAWRVAGAARALLVTGLVIAVGSGLASLVVARGHDDARRQAYRIQNPTVVPVSMSEEGDGAASPFHPSSATTNTRGIIPSNFFMTSESCARCHKDIYDQWNSSMHHFSSFNNQWYRKSIEYMQDVVGTQPSKWCAGCHDHAVFFNGRFDRPIKEQIDTPEAQAGLGCMSCHAITHVRSTMGQGDFEIEYPPLHDLAVSEQPLLRWSHDKLLALDPQVHRETFLKPFHTDQTADFCSSCHKVHLDAPVNSYRWIRGFNDYDNWQASGVSGMGARSFYYPAKPQKCADCHMELVASNDPAAKNGLIKSHRFPAANTAVPFVNGDTTQLEAVQRFLQNGQVTVDLFGIVRGGPQTEARSVGARAEPRLSSSMAVGEESMAFGAAGQILTAPAEVVGPLGRVPVAVRPGESVRVEVVVRTRKVGHFFPGGTVDGFDVWVELQATDGRGQTILHSGLVEADGKGPVEPGAHFYRSLMLDGQGNPINKRNAFATRSVAYVRLVPPGAADTVHYRLEVPKDVVGPISLKAKVNYRKFAWWNTQWAYAGVRDPQQGDFTVDAHHDNGRWVFTGDTSKVSGAMKQIPDLPITVVAEANAELQVLPNGAALPPDAPLLDASVRERWNDYGIGLLLQGDLKGAEAAFLKVTQMDPGYADGYVNVGRARVQEGNITGAEEVLRKALTLAPDLAKTHFFLGTALKSAGRYDEAVEHLRKAAAQYPRDRVVRNQLGRVLFLKRQYTEAVTEFRAALDVDPEDLQAHYNLMLAYQGLGDAAGAAREQTLYERFKADESAQAITGPYRQLHPHDNNERQAIHEHATVSGTVAGTYTATPGRARAKPPMTAARRPVTPPATAGGTQ